MKYINSIHMTKKIITLFGVILSITLLKGCDEPPPPPLELTGYRVFGIQADPPIARPNEKVTFTVYDYHPLQTSFIYNWSVCLYSYGGSTEFECVDNNLFIQLFEEITPRITVDLGPNGVNLRQLLLTYGQAPDVGGKSRNLAQGLDIYIILKSGYSTDQLTRTVKRLHVIDVSGDSPLGQNPVIKGWKITESEVNNLLPPCVVTPIAGDLGIDREDVQEEILGAEEKCVVHASAHLDVELDVIGEGVDQTNPKESYVYTWYSDKEIYAEYPLTFGASSKGQYKLPNRAGPLELLFTVRTPQGGFTMGRQELLMAATPTTQF